MAKAWAADTLTSDFWLQNRDRIHVCCFIPPSLWEIVMVALGNKYGCLLDINVEMVKWPMNLDFRGKIWAGDTKLRVFSIEVRFKSNESG